MMAKVHISVSTARNSSYVSIILRCIGLMVAVLIHNERDHSVTFVVESFASHKNSKFTLRGCIVVSLRIKSQKCSLIHKGDRICLKLLKQEKEKKTFYAAINVTFPHSILNAISISFMIFQIWQKFFVIFNVNYAQSSWDHVQHCRDTQRKFIVEIQQLLVVHVARNSFRIEAISKFTCSHIRV